MTQTRHRRRMIVGWVLLALGTVALVGSLSMLLRARRSAVKAGMSVGVSPGELFDKWGVDSLRVRRSAAGHLLDFRYRVVDLAKAAGIHNRKARPYLLDLKSGRKLAVPSTPKAGSLWNHRGVRPGKTYFALFSNTGGVVRRGDRVRVVIDKFVAGDLVVE